MNAPRSVPSLDELVAEPATAAELPAGAAVAMLKRCNEVLAAHEALREALRARIASAATAAGNGKPALLSTEDVARLLGRSKSWVEHHLDDLPPRCTLLGAPVWHRRVIEEWVESLPEYGDTS